MDKQWEADRYGSAWAVYKAGYRKSPDRIAFVCVVETSEGNPSDKITKANADLIAAAPELLAACEAALKYLPSVGDAGALQDSRLKAEVRAAIAKAKGAA